MVSYLDAYKFNQDTAQAGLDQMAAQKRNAAVAEAGKLMAAGDLKGAATIMYQADPALTTKIFEKYVTDLDPEKQSAVTGANANATLGAQTGYGANARQLADANNASQEKIAGMRLQAEAKKPPPEDTFTKTTRRKGAESFEKVKVAGGQAGEQVDLIDDAINEMYKYYNKNPGGTGPFATFGGLKAKYDTDTQALNSKFKLINIKNMAATFQGMSKAVDSNTERAAWEATQPSLTNDDSVNANILLGAKALALKAKAEAKAQQEWVAKEGNLDKYVPEVFGKTSAVVSPDGEMMLVPKGQKEDALQNGFMDIDSYAKDRLKKIDRHPAKRIPAPETKTTAPKANFTPGSLVQYNNKQYRVAADGDTLIEVK